MIPASPVKTMTPMMMLYAWEDLDSPNEVKFGEHFVNRASSYSDARLETERYIRSSLARQKYTSTSLVQNGISVIVTLDS